MSAAKRPLCYVLMPSGKNGEYRDGEDESNAVFEDIIRPGVEKALGKEVDLTRETDTNKPGAITINIVRNVARADIVIVDITGRNPNVFFELGMRYALRRNGRILIRRRRSDPPNPFRLNVVWGH